jgi:hypothetical protein
VRLNHRRLQIRPLHAGAQNVIARRAAGLLELHCLREPLLSKRKRGVLDFGEVCGEESLEIRALHVEGDLRSDLGLIQSCRAPRGCCGPRSRHYPAPLKKGLG